MEEDTTGTIRRKILSFLPITGLISQLPEPIWALEMIPSGLQEL